MRILALTAEVDHPGGLAEVRAVAEPLGVTVSPVMAVGPTGHPVSHFTGSFPALLEVLRTLGYDPAEQLNIRLA